MNNIFSSQSKVVLINCNVRVFLTLSLFLIVSLLSHTVMASGNADNADIDKAEIDKAEIDKILEMNSAPNGVVFELIGQENSNYLLTALTKIATYKNQLKKKFSNKKFPNIKVAVVSHGAEQFELTTDNAKKEIKSHHLVKRITAEDVPVHICEGHASWRQVKAKDFPGYITPISSGPAKIREYQALAYLLVIVE